MREKILQSINLVGRDGKVKHIHTGFASPASGVSHAELKAGIHVRPSSQSRLEVRYRPPVASRPAGGLYVPTTDFTIRNNVPSMAIGKTATPNTTINE